MSNIVFLKEAFEDYIYWQSQDKKTLKRINQILKDILRNENNANNTFDGIGKPEQLKGDLSGWCSRRIDDKNRIVYRVIGEQIEIAQCRNHYKN